MNRVIAYLLEENHISTRDLQKCLQLQKHYKSQGKDVSLYDILVHCNLISEDKLQCLISMQEMGETQVLQKKHLGKYLIKETLGQGGMGVVYKATDGHLQREIALKVMNNAQISDKQRKRFSREAVMMASLDHPNIVKVFEAGEEAGCQFIAMEFIAGQDLSFYMQELDLVKKVHILIKAAEAVHFAHTRGVIHRDLKPENIMIDANYQPRVMDFGLAKQVGGEKLSRTGEIAGTPLYMSPEQINGQGIDARTDVYSLGIILYEMMVGKTPFVGKNNIMFEILMNDVKPPCDIDKGLSKDLEAICLKAIEKRQNMRYKTANDLACDLKSYLQGSTIAAKPFTLIRRFKRKFSRNIKVISSVFIIVLLGVIFSIMHFYQGEQEFLQAKLQKEQLQAYKDKLQSYRDQLENEIILAQKYASTVEYKLANDRLRKIQITRQKKPIQPSSVSINNSDEIKILQKDIGVLLKCANTSLKYIPQENIYNPVKNFLGDINDLPKEYELPRCFQPSWNWIIVNSDSKSYLYTKRPENKWHKQLLTHFVLAYAVSPQGMLAVLCESEKKILFFEEQSGELKSLHRYNELIAAKITAVSDIENFYFSPYKGYFFTKIMHDNGYLFDLIKLKSFYFDVLARYGAISFKKDKKLIAVGDRNRCQIVDLSKVNGEVIALGKSKKNEHIVFDLSRGVSALHFDQREELYAGYFDISKYSNNKIEHLVPDGNSILSYLQTSPKTTFLASYETSGLLLLRQSNSPFAILKNLSRKRTRINSILLDDDKYGIWEQSKISIYKRKSCITEIDLYQKIPKKLQAILTAVHQMIPGFAKSLKERDNVDSFSKDLKYIIKVSPLFLRLLNIQGKEILKLPVVSNSVKAKRFWEVKQVEFYNDRYVCLIVRDYLHINTKKKFICFDLKTQKIVLEKIFPIQCFLQFCNKKILFKNYSAKPWKQNIYNIVFQNSKVNLEDSHDQVYSELLKNIFAKSKMVSYKEKIAFVSIEPHKGTEKHNLCILEDKNTFYRVPDLEMGRVSAIKFITKDVIAIGSTSGEVALVRLRGSSGGKNQITNFNIGGIIRGFFFDVEENALIVDNHLGLNIVPLGYTQENALFEKIYPIKLFHNYKTEKILVNTKSNQIVLMLTNKCILMIDEPKKE